jgi:predicted Zn-ribbon and HTH transcriptional regulator
MPELETIQVQGFKCYRCGYRWVPKNPSKPPRTCPHCKSPYWDRERTRAIKKD